MDYSWEKLQSLRPLIPALDALFVQYYDLASASVQAALTGHNVAKAEAARACFVRRMDEQIPSILRQNNYDPKNYVVQYQCPQCQDKGYLIENGKKQPCACRIAKKADRENGDYPWPTFDQFDLSVFPAGSQRDSVAGHHRALMCYAEAFPHTPKQNFLLLGPSGLGKTFLLSCVSQALRAKKVPVRFVTAYQMQEKFQEQHFGGKDALAELIRIPFLAIDDLGTEPILRNISLEYFYTLLEERGRQGRHTALASNLTPAQISNRYGERIYSRLLSNAQCDVYGFCGKDVRLLVRLPKA